MEDHRRLPPGTKPINCDHIKEYKPSVNDTANIEYESNDDTDCIYYNDLVMNNGGL